MSDQYPVFGPPQKQRPIRGGVTLGTVLLGIFIGTPLLFIGAAKLYGCVGDDDIEDRPSSSCADPAAAFQREQWIKSESADLSGYSPSTMRMSAIGNCADSLRVREENCSPGNLSLAYGNKPFMRTAAKLGFTKVSCGYDEFKMSDIIRWGASLAPRVEE